MSKHKQEVKRALQKAVNVGLGLSQIVGDRVRDAITGLEKKGYINRSEGKKLAHDLLGEANKLQKSFSSSIDKRVQKVVKSGGKKSTAKTKAKKSKKQ